MTNVYLAQSFYVEKEQNGIPERTTVISVSAKRLRNFCIQVVCVCLCVCECVCVCVCVYTYVRPRWSCITIQFPIHCNTTEGRYPLRYVAIEIWHYLRTRTTAFVTTLSVSPKYLKCNISITKCPIALSFDTRVRHQKVYTTNCQWLDKHQNCIHDNTFYIPQFFEMQYIHE